MKYTDYNKNFYIFFIFFELESDRKFFKVQKTTIFKKKGNMKILYILNTSQKNYNFFLESTVHIDEEKHYLIHFYFLLEHILYQFLGKVLLKLQFFGLMIVQM